MKISVVIPALDEADHIEAAIRGAARGAHAPGDAGQYAERAERNHAATRRDELGIRGGSPGGPEVSGRDLEILVVDGGSRDQTERIASAAGARVVRSGRGRARQLAAGVAASRGAIVLFLHADTRLPEGWAGAVREALRDPRVVGGAFRFRFDERSPALRFIEWGARLRTALFRMPYGDQALFLRREALEAMGGVPQTPVMEDLDLLREMKRRGRLALLPLAVVTSARRYRAGGPLRTMLRHWVAAAGFALRVDRRRLARWVGH